MRGFSVGFASIVGSFFVYGAHLACGGGRVAPRAVPTTAAQTTSASASSSVSSSGEGVAPMPKGDCGCATPRTHAFFAVSGDEKMSLDPVDAEARIDAAYARNPAGKKLIVLSGVVRAYRTDAPSEHPTTLAIRIAYPEGSGASGVKDVSAKEIEANLTTWSGSMVAPRVYAVVAKSAVTITASDTLVEIRGALTLKDPPTGRTIVLEKLTLKKQGTALLPERNAIFHP